jgi:hypothetical protein
MLSIPWSEPPVGLHSGRRGFGCSLA